MQSLLSFLLVHVDDTLPLSLPQLRPFFLWETQLSLVNRSGVRGAGGRPGRAVQSLGQTPFHRGSGSG